MFYRTSKRLMLALAVGVIAASGVLHSRATFAADGVDGGSAPNPALSPGQVVKIQLDALRANDTADTGIEIAFRFASPANKSNTGPLPRFASMIKQGVYALMLDYVDAEYEPVEIVGTRARQKVTLIGTAQVVTYVFYLSRQKDAVCDGCWMTDAVGVERIAAQSARRSAPIQPGTA